MRKEGFSPPDQLFEKPTTKRTVSVVSTLQGILHDDR
jgi:hypothetical protein